MSTTNHPGATSADLPNSASGHRPKQRLSVILARRDRLATRWAEHESHRLADADDLAHELAVCEQAIGHCWPAVYNAKFGDWVARDAALLHDMEQPNDVCTICSGPGQSTTQAA